jgi:tetratricopeptide (TPR) repeat protein
MKNKCSALLILLSIYVIGFCPTCYAAETTEALSLTISSAKARFVVSEPLTLRLTLQNLGNTDLAVDSTYCNGRSWASYWHSRDGKQFTPIEMFVSTDPPRGGDISLMPGESMFHDEILTFDYASNRVTFPEPGFYFIRVLWRGKQSNILRLQATAPTTRIDKKWSEIMKNREIANAISFPESGSGLIVQRLNECANARTVFSPYAAFALGITESNKERAMALMNKADSSDSPMQSFAVFEKGKILLELGDKIKARKQFERVLRDFPDSGAASQVRLNRLAEIPVEKKPDPPNPWIAAYKELHAEYYDTRSLSADQTPWVKEMKRKETELIEKGALGQIPMNEAYRQAGEVTKAYVRKHDKPLSKSEWNRRYKIYAEQDAASQARQRAIQMKNAPENIRILKEHIAKRQQEKKPK